jgi:nucleoside-diphosphate-sugar epimerase
MKNASEKSSILMIGGAGYIGSTLVRMALAGGHTVKVLDSLLYNNLVSLGDVIDHPDFTFIKGDFCDPKTAEAALRGVNHVVLLAALVGDPISKKYPDAAKKINEDGPKKLFDLVKKFPIDRFVFTSTCSNYGLRESEDFATEEAELNPQSLYATCKVAVEKYLLENGGSSSPATILRLATAYGTSTRMRFDLTVSEFTRALALGQDLLVYDENTWRPYCHVRDISRAVLSVIGAPKTEVAGQVFNVGSNAENLTKKQIVTLIQKNVSGGSVSYKKGGKDPRNYRVSFDKIARKLDFKTTQTVEASVKSLAAALQNGAFADSAERRTYYENYEINISAK